MTDGFNEGLDLLPSDREKLERLGWTVEDGEVRGYGLVLQLKVRRVV